MRIVARKPAAIGSNLARQLLETKTVNTLLAFM